MSIEYIVFGIPALLLAISFHEFAHGIVAYRMGDPTPKYQGRLTLNPLAHLDPMGALMLLVFRFGWARPVMINASYFKDPRRGMLLVALAGPLANLTLAWLFYSLIGLVLPLIPSFAWRNSLQFFLIINLQYNLGLAAFNLLPVPPLDGSKILGGLLPRRMLFSYERFSQYGPLVLILLLMTGVLQVILRPLYQFLFLLISGFRG